MKLDRQVGAIRSGRPAGFSPIGRSARNGEAGAGGVSYRHARPFSLRSPAMVFYGVGSIASAAKSTPITTFLMIFYNQVVGLPALSVSFILMISLLLDAVFDPMVGHLSDNLRSRLGRRLPLMYASAIPLAGFFILLWMPPAGWSPAALLCHLAVCLVGVRLFDTFFELPHAALVPELTNDYHGRTQIFTVRSLCESASGLLISWLAYNVFMRQAADGSGGILSAQGYSSFAIMCGAIIAICILVSTVGLQYWAPQVASAEAGGRPAFSWPAFLETVRSPSLLTLVGATLLISIASGTGSALGLYWMIYYFGFSQAEITLLALPATLGFVSVAVAPAVTRWMGKRNAAILLCWFYALAGAIPMLARVAGWVAPDSPVLFAIVAVQCFLGPAAITIVMIALSSMIADLVEETEVRTGRRSEGLLLSTVTFVRKMMTGAGTLVAGFILMVVSFPENAQRGDVTDGQLLEMVGYYLAFKVALFVAATFVLRRYRYSQFVHEANLRFLAERRQESGAP